MVKYFAQQFLCVPLYCLIGMNVFNYCHKMLVQNKVQQYQFCLLLKRGGRKKYRGYSNHKVLVSTLWPLEIRILYYSLFLLKKFRVVVNIFKNILVFEIFCSCKTYQGHSWPYIFPEKANTREKLLRRQLLPRSIFKFNIDLLFEWWYLLTQ